MFSRSQIVTIIGSFFLLTFAVYGLSLGNGFVAWDDNYLIVSNSIIRGFSWSHIVSAFTSFDPELYDPLVFVVYMFDYTISGSHAVMFHLTNLMLHTLNALGVCWLLLLLTRKRWIGIVGGLLFAVHPLNTEAVSWAAATKDVLSTFFFLGSLIGYLQYRDGVHRRHFWYALSIVLFVLGLLSKVMVLTLPLVLILLDLHAHRRWNKTALLEKIPYVFLSAAFGILALWGKADTVTESTLAEKLLMAAKSTVFYLESFFLPLQLSVLYPYSKTITLASPDFFVPVIVLVGLIGIVVYCWNRLRDVSIGLLFYIVTLIPTFFNFAKGGYFYVASDRYAYIPQIGILFLLLILIDRFVLSSPKNNRRTMVFMSAGVIIAILSGLALQQSLTWKNTETLFVHTISLHPDASAARLNLGYVYRESSLFDQALQQFQAVLQKEPTNALAYANIGQVYEKQGKDDEAIAAYQKGMALRPHERDSFMSLGLLYEKLGRIDDALIQYKQVAIISPTYYPVYNNLGSIYVQKQDLPDAAAAYLQAVTINPYYADAHFNLAYVYAKQGNLEGAAMEYEKTLAIEGEKVDTLTTLAGVYAEQNKTTETVRTLHRILAIDPTNHFANTLLNALTQSGLAH